MSFTFSKKTNCHCNRERENINRLDLPSHPSLEKKKKKKLLARWLVKTDFLKVSNDLSIPTKIFSCKLNSLVLSVLL